MGRNPTTGEYNYPDGTPGNPNQTIFSTRYNTFINDLRNTLNTKLPINMGGTGADDAAEARDNIDAEVAMQVVNNYDTHVWEAGSFYAAGGATAAPTANSHSGIVTVASADNLTVEARDHVTGINYIRRKSAGVWVNGGAWAVDGTGQFVKLAGDTMTGDLTIKPAATHARFHLHKSASGDVNAINGYTGADPVTGVRWSVQPGDAVAETGGNAGSDFSIFRFSDTGATLSVALSINRATGTMTVGDVVTASNGRLWGASDGSPVFKGAVNTITNTMAINGNLAGMWVCSFINNSAAASAGGIYTQVANDTNMSLAVLNAAATQWAHAFFGNGNYSCSGSITAGGNITTPAINTTGQSTMIQPGAAGPVYGVGLHIGFPGGGAGYGISLRQAANDTIPIIFMQPGGAVIGNIATTGASTAYNTTSDGRLKTDVKAFDAGPILDAIKVYDFAWKATGDRAYGVVAQETIEVFPQAVTHSKEIDVWGVDYAKFVPLLLQEIKTLRERVAALEART